MTIYSEDLAFIHHAGFSSFADAAAPGLLALLGEAGIARGLVVDLGCGSGVWARALLDAGFEVFGVDGSLDMIALASSVAPRGTYRVASLHSVEIPPCVAVTAIGEALGYIAPEDPRYTLPDLFTRIHDALIPGGLLVFDVVLRSLGEPMRYRSSREADDWRVDVEVEELPDEYLLTRRIEIERRVDGGWRRSREVHRVRTFAREELAKALGAAGFSTLTLTSYGSAELPPGRLAFGARKEPGSQRG